MVKQRTAQPDVISIAAMWGAVLFVGASLLYRIANGHGKSVAFMAAIAAVVLWVYVRVVSLDNLNDDEKGNESS